MIRITKNEAEYLRANGKGYDVHMSSATHKSRAKRFYATTSPKTMKLLEKYRKQEVIEEHNGR